MSQSATIHPKHMHERRLVSAKEYTIALEAIARRGLSAHRRTMLLAHYAMPRHIATMRHLAATVGQTTAHNYANLQYGGLASRLRDELGLRRGGLALWTLATWPEKPVNELREFSFRMRPELARAIELLGWSGELPTVPDVTRVVPVAPEGERILQWQEHRKRERGALR